MRTLLLTLTVMAGILAQAWGQDTVRINNTTKAVISPIPFRVGQSAVDPTAPGNGSIWYDTTNNTLEARVNGVTINLGAGGGGDTLPIADTTAVVKGSVDATKLLRLEVDGFTTGATRVLTPPNYNGTIATLAGTETLSAKTLASPTISGAFTLPDDVRQTFNPGATASGFNVGSQAGDPSAPTNGDIWYDSTANTLDARINGATVNLGAGGGLTVGTTTITGGVGGRVLYETGGNVLGELTTTGSGSVVLAAGTLNIVTNKTLSVDNTMTFGGTDGTAHVFPISSSSLARIDAAQTFTGTQTFSGNINPSSGNSYALGSVGAGLEWFSVGARSVIVGHSGGSVQLTAEATGILQLGVDAATGSNFMLKAMDATAGTGGNLTLAAGLGTTAGGQLIFQTAVNTAGGYVDAAKLDNSTTAGHTRFFLYDVDNATLERVTVGAADSGGVGFKVLRIPN